MYTKSSYLYLFIEKNICYLFTAYNTYLICLSRMSVNGGLKNIPCNIVSLYVWKYKSVVNVCCLLEVTYLITKL